MTNLPHRFQTLTGFTPRPFQHQTIEHLLAQTSVILRAPTGSGKTETAIAPFLFAFETDLSFPQKLIYVVPLRTLANSLRDRAQHLVQRFCPPTQRQPLVTLQTGENPEDPRLEGDIIFCTIDQLLSSYLNIPYSVGRGSSNLNAGAILAAYLVFDEIHLLDPQRAFTTLLKLLRDRGSLAPSLLMTATVTQTTIATIHQEIQQCPGNADMVIASVELEATELAAIEVGRTRRVNPIEQSLDAQPILDDLHHHNRQRIIAICNTIAAAQALYEDLHHQITESGATIQLILLHSRFLPCDRAQKEAQIQTQFAQNSDITTPIILIATQVIEVGLNVTCDVLHTQLAPMNALVQRIGRCARFSGETGQVWVYRSPETPTFQPYDPESCEQTWAVLLSHHQSPQAQRTVSFGQEIQWLETVHEAADQLAILQRQQNQDQFARDVQAALQRGDRSTTSKLIRDIDSRRVYSIADTPLMLDGTNSLETFEPQDYQPFAMPTRTLHGLLSQAKNSLIPIDWLFKRVEFTEKTIESYRRTAYLVPVTTHEDLKTSLNIVVNPSYVSYDADLGLRISLEGGNGYTSPPQAPTPQNRGYAYVMDTYTAHIALLGRAWRDDFQGRNAVGTPLKIMGSQLLRRHWQIPNSAVESLFELLVYLAIWGHDLGKLQQSWQDSMRGWQAITHQHFDGQDPRHHLLAHTDYDPSQDHQKSALKTYEKQHPRPPHAVESACLFEPLFGQYFVPVLMTEFGVERRVVMDWLHVLQLSIGRHHSAWAKGWDHIQAKKAQPLVLHPKADSAIAQSWRALVVRSHLPTAFKEITPHLQTHTLKPKAVSLEKVPLHRLEIRLLYSLIVRSLRLADIRAVQIGGQRPKISVSYTRARPLA